MLAEMIGTTRSRVSNFMNKFRDLGFIIYNGNIEFHSSLLTVLLHDKPQIRRDEAFDTECAVISGDGGSSRPAHHLRPAGEGSKN
jgi:hypothetical protein